MVVDRTRIRINKCNKFLQTSWTAIFGAIAALEGIVLAWGAQKFYHAWTRLFSFVVAIRLPWQAGNEVKTDDVAPVEAPKRPTRSRQTAIGARDVCYNSIDASSMS